MPQKIDIKIENFYKKNDLYTKYASIKIGSRGYVPLFPAINPRRVHYNTLKSLTQPIPIENYIEIPIEKLREMDSDQEKQKAFITEKLDNISGSTTLFITKLLVKNHKIEDKDVDYLVDLLNFPSNDIMVTPLVYHYATTTPSEHFPKGKNVPTKGISFDSYLPFVKTFLEKAEKRHIESFSLTLPNNLSHTDLEKLLTAYKDYDTKIAVIDAKGSKITQLAPQISKLISSDEKLYTLPQKNKENFVLYSFDCIPYTAHLREVAPAENIVQYWSGFSWFGPRHTIFGGGESKVIPPPRLYGSDRYGYVKHDSKEYANEKKEFDEWFEKTYNGVNSKNKLEYYKKDYEIKALAASVDDFYKNIEDEKFWDNVIKKPHITDVIKRIQNMNKNDLKV